jgi:hypothetical protein
MRFRIIAVTGGMYICFKIVTNPFYVQEDTYFLELTRYIHMKSDERILGDSDFIQSVLDEAKERLEERYRLQAQGV